MLLMATGSQLQPWVRLTVCATDDANYSVDLAIIQKAGAAQATHVTVLGAHIMIIQKCISELFALSLVVATMADVKHPLLYQQVIDCNYKLTHH